MKMQLTMRLLGSTALLTTALAVAHLAQAESSHALTPLTMRVARAAHTATLLADGRVLIAGGFQVEGQSLASAELFDPATNRFAPAGELVTPRVGHAAIRLRDGRVLLAGGWDGRTRTNALEVFDPETGTFNAAGKLSTPLAEHTLTLLADGRVLIASGLSARNAPSDAVFAFDPDTGRVTRIGALKTGRGGHTATLLRDGRLLIVGGTGKSDAVLADAEVFDVQTGRTAEVIPLLAPRRKHAAALLADGRVMLIGGSDGRDWHGQYDTTEIYDPTASRFIAGPRLNADRFKLADAVATLRDGSLIVAGGDAQVERYDAQRNRVAPAATLDDAYFSATATALPDGRVLIAGGYDRDITASRNAWLLR
jgi:hypothetical protein